MLSAILHKHCSSCGRDKDRFADFSKRRASWDGRCAKCKSCSTAYRKRWAAANSDKTAIYARRYHERHPAERREQLRSWREANPEKAQISDERNRTKFPEKSKARWLVKNALRSGTLVKPSACEDCGEQKPSPELHGHHEDYSKPLEVNWICPKCHAVRHHAE